MHIWLEGEEIHHNPKTILRVMQKYSLLSVIRRKKYLSYGDCLHKIEILELKNRIKNWLQIFHTSKPNKEYYICLSSEICLTTASYKTGTQQNPMLVLSTITEAKKKEKVTAKLQLHSD